ncbi:MAG: LicD family protein [Eubacterium sp.]|nr:LicD family protein [Candidatus Colimonas fimequi]
MNISENKDIKNTQRILMGIVMAFDKVCQDNDIEYFLAGGTTLGAVRHEGFLPWDDDVDLYMKASVWEANKEIIRDSLPEKYGLVCDEFDEYYDNPVIRIVDNETTQISRSRISDRSAHGVQIDIFLLDPIPDDKEERKEYKEDFWVYCEIKTPTMILANPKVPVSAEMEEKYRHYLARVANEGREKVVDELEKKLFSLDPAKCHDCHLRWGGYWVVAPIDAFREAVRVPFENEMLPIPIGYPDVMYGEYGDTWMMVPDASNIWDHDNVQNDYVPYAVYDKAIEAEIDLDEYRQVQAKNKAYKIERLFHDSKFRKYYTKNMDAIAVALLSDDDNIDKFVRMQKKLFKEHHLVKLDDEKLRSILLKTVIEGDLDFARGINEFYEGEDEGIREILDDVASIRRIRFSYFLDEGDKYLDEAIELEKKYPNQVNLLEFISVTKVMKGEASDELGKFIENAIKLHGYRPRLMKIAADYEANRGNGYRAEEIYQEVLMTSRDGMVNLEINRKLRKGNA